MFTATGFSPSLRRAIAADVRALNGASVQAPEPEGWINDNDGARYFSWQIDYKCGGIVASRCVANIPAGSRTELAFWKPADAATRRPQRLDVHQGSGSLLVGRCLKRSDVVPVMTLDDETNQRGYIPNGHMYTIRAAAHDDLVVSSLYRTPLDWAKLETVFAASATEVVHAGTVELVPTEFTKLVAAPAL